MIVVDTSAIITIIAREPNHQAIAARLLSSPKRIVPATAVVEATMVLSRFHQNPKLVFDLYKAAAGLDILPIDEAIVVVAQEAFLTFGKGRHPAKLNLCDCFSYASAKILGSPLLFTGNDFPQTDILIA